MQEVYTRKELKEIYKKAETRYLKTVFQDDCVTYRHTNDIIDYLQPIANQHGCDDDRVNKLTRELRNLSRSLGSLINGDRGECATRDTLSHMTTQNERLESVCLALNGERAEIDFVVITSKGIFLVETKFYTTDVVIDKRGIIRSARYPWFEDYDTCRKLKSKEYVFSGVLKPKVGSLATGENIHSMLVFANNHRTWKDLSQRYPVHGCWDALYDIEHYDGEDVFDDRDIVRIKEAILDVAIENKFPVSVDLDGIEDGLSYVLEAISADASDGDSEVVAELPAKVDTAKHNAEGDLKLNISPEPACPPELPYLDLAWATCAASFAAVLLYGACRHPDMVKHAVRKICF